GFYYNPWWNYYWYPWYSYPIYGYDRTYYGYPYDSGDTTYNYNYYGNYGSTDVLVPGTTVGGVEVPDYNALSAAGAKSDADKFFDMGVTEFGNSNYASAVENFRTAVRLDTADTDLPFAYAQALFANNEYEKASAVLTTALFEMSPQKAEISYPRGMYADQSVLDTQIGNLKRAVLMDPTSGELQLLYGYQLLGVGKYDEAKVSLNVAKNNAKTAPSASMLLELADRMQQQPSNK
ncbi:MAG: hypothetical protein A2178_02135, partial [Planctomycetes bacterium GWC2_49_10]